MNTLLSKMFSGARIVLFTALMLGCVTASAQLRVIIEYDDTEHRLMRVIELPSIPAAPESDHLQADSAKHITTNVILLWLDANGELLSTTSIADPRLVHAPLTGDDQAPSVVGLTDGAYMVEGPSESVTLDIQLPANGVLGLVAQTWRIELLR